VDPLEELHKVVVQGFASLNDKIDSVEARLGGRIDSVEAKLGGRIDSVEAKLGDRIDSLSAKMDAGFARVDREFELVKRGLLDHMEQFKEIRVTLDKKVDRDEVEAIVERAVARATGH